MPRTLFSPTPLLIALPRLRRSELRGFTLIELMVVVVIISVLAVIAIPAISRRMQDRRTQSAAQEVSTIYRNARLRALGRGSAVMVRYDSSVVPQGSFTVREAIRGTANAAMNANCQALPFSSCLAANWTAVGSRLITTYTPSSVYLTSSINININDPDGTPRAQFDVCFTPLGRTFSRIAQGAAFTPLGTVPIARVWRDSGSGTAVGLERIVMIPPNGAARLGTSRERP